MPSIGFVILCLTMGGPKAPWWATFIGRGLAYSMGHGQPATFFFSLDGQPAAWSNSQIMPNPTSLALCGLVRFEVACSAMVNRPSSDCLSNVEKGQQKGTSFEWILDFDVNYATICGVLEQDGGLVTLSFQRRCMAGVTGVAHLSVFCLLCSLFLWFFFHYFSCVGCLLGSEERFMIMVWRLCRRPGAEECLAG